MDREYITLFPDGTQIRWKPLVWSEFKVLQKDYKNLLDTNKEAAEWLLHEAAAASCVLDQEQDGKQVNFEDIYAGAIWVVGTHILKESGFVNDADIIKKRQTVARSQFTYDWYEQVMSYIMFFFKKSEEEIRDWTIHKFMEYSVRVETLLGNTLDVATEEPQDDQVKYRTTPDGRKIPIITKQDLNRRKRINITEDNKEINRSYRRHR